MAIVARFANDALPLTRAERAARPAIITNGGLALRELIAAARDAVLAANEPPSLFRVGNQIVRLARIEDRVVQEPMSKEMMLARIMRAANWMKVFQGVLVGSKPPAEIAPDYIANVDPRLPELRRVAVVPLLRRAGTLLYEEGYDASSGIYFARPPDLILPTIPEKPTQADVDGALNLVREQLLVDFPFAAPSDWTHALALLITPFIRLCVDGPTPLFAIVAPCPGSGKGLLADIVHLIFDGTTCPVSTISTDESEMRKKLTAMLIKGFAVILLDNVNAVDSAQIAAAVTAVRWSDRLLGKSRLLDLPNQTVWMLTGNNPTLSMELARRSVRIRIAPSSERPWERNGFTHADLRSWVRANRPKLVGAILVLIQNWIAIGRPMGSTTMGSFEHWSQTVGGILGAARVEGFLDDRHEFYAAADPETDEWRAFVADWRERRIGKVRARDLLDRAIENDLVPDAIGNGNVQAQLARFSKALKRQAGRLIDGYRICSEMDPHTKVALYWVEEVAP